MAFYEKLEGPALVAYTKTLNIVKTRAIQERMLRPEDLGLSTPVWTFNISSANAWNTIIDNAQIADSRFVGIYGLLLGESGTSVVTQLKVTRMGEVVRYWQIQDVNFLESPVIYFDDPITIDQNTTIKIEAYADATDSEWRATFLGVVAEKRGLLVK